MTSVIFWMIEQFYGAELWLTELITWFGIKRLKEKKENKWKLSVSLNCLACGEGLKRWVLDKVCSSTHIYCIKSKLPKEYWNISILEHG